MNLFELAHHPEAWKAHIISFDFDNYPAQSCHWWDGDNSTREQFEMLNDNVNTKIHIDKHEDENCFRMHLLFVHWATLKG